MDFIHSKDYFNKDDIVVIQCSHECNIMLLDNTNYDKYRSHQKFDYYGGRYTRFPAKIKVPKSDNWNVVIDLGGASANIKYSIEVVKKS